jgi:hypothetical protein
MDIADTTSMDISGANALDNGIISSASRLQGERTSLQIGTAILKQIQNSQANQAQALIKMIDSAPSPAPDGTGSIINIGV